jgi:hypothetical protein
MAISRSRGVSLVFQRIAPMCSNHVMVTVGECSNSL